MRVKAQEGEQVLEVSSDKENLLDVLKKANLYVKSGCGGHASCGDCTLKILGGEDLLLPPKFDELKLLGNVFHLTKERLACQTYIEGDVSIDLSHHDYSKDSEKIKNKKPFKPKARVRKSTDVHKMYEERKSKSDEKSIQRDESENAYFEHWKKEKSDDPMAKRKKLDGGNRPRPFLTPDRPDDSDQSEKFEPSLENPDGNSSDGSSSC